MELSIQLKAIKNMFARELSFLNDKGTLMKLGIAAKTQGNERLFELLDMVDHVSSIIEGAFMNENPYTAYMYLCVLHSLADKIENITDSSFAGFEKRIVDMEENGKRGENENVSKLWRKRKDGSFGSMFDYFFSNHTGETE